MTAEQGGAFIQFNRELHSGERDFSGLDMAPTLAWYAMNSNFLGNMLDARLAQANPVEVYGVKGLDQTQISPTDIASIIGLFPQQARERSIAMSISGKPSLWFHKDSETTGPRPTADQAERLSSTAIIPSYVEYVSNETPLRFGAQIDLYNIPDDVIADPQVAKLILAEGAAHEYFHTLVAGLLYSEDCLRLPDGRIVDGWEFIMVTFGNLAEQHDPISHYSSFYRTDDNGYRQDGKGDITTAVAEELVEAGTTYVLGYGSGSHVDLSGDPFADRPELTLFFEDFLHADLVSGSLVEKGTTVSGMDLVNEYRARFHQASE